MKKTLRIYNRRLFEGLCSLLVLPTCALLVTGCIPEEAPIAPFDRGNAEQHIIEMESDYRYQLFYDLGTGSVVKKMMTTEWDLGFQSDPVGNYVVLNSAKIMAAANLGPVEFTTEVSVSGLEWNYDHPSGSWDSNACGVWWTEGQTGEEISSKRELFVVDRGYDATGEHLGYMKVMLLGATDENYTVRFAHLDNSGDQTMTVQRDELRNIVGLNLEKGVMVEAEPPKDQWDILFTRYTNIFYEPTFTPYSVTGVQLNRYRTVAAEDSVNAFESITSDRVEGYMYSSDLDVIGYDWKYFDFTDGFIIESPVYVVRDSEGFYYKMLFLDFYNAQGEKGFPTFQQQRL